MNNEQLVASERERRIANERFEALLIATSAVQWLVDPMGNAVEPATAWMEFTGQSWNQAKGKGWVAAIHPEDRERIAARWAPRPEASASSETEYRLRRSDGSFARMKARRVPLMNPDGTVREWLLAGTDVTEVREKGEALARQASELRAANETLAAQAEELRVREQELRGLFDELKHHSATVDLEVEARTVQVAQQAELIELVPAAILVRTVADSTIRFWNQGAERLYGWSADEAMGQVTHELLQTRFPHPIEEIMAELRRVGRWSGELLHRCKDGRVICVDSCWALQRDGDTEPIGILEVNTDITERKRAEEHLRFFELFVRSVSEYALITCDPGGNVISWNEGARRMSGYSADEVVGTNYARFFTEEDRARGLPEAELQAVARNGHFESIAWRVRKDGTRYPADVAMTALRDEAGRVIGIAKITRDLTERLRMEETLREQSQFVSELLDKLPGGVCYLDCDLNYRLVNEAYARLIDRPVSEIVGRNLLEVFPGLEESAVDTVRQVLVTHERSTAYSFPVELTHPEGGRRQTYWDFTINPRFDERGEVIGLLVLAFEVSARVELEKELERQRDLSQRMIDSVPAGISYLDRDLVYRQVNPAMLELIQLPVDRMLGHRLFDILPGAVDYYGPMLCRVLEAGTPQSGRGTPLLMARDGKEVMTYWDFAYEPDFDPSGRVQGIVVLALEVTERMAHAKLLAERIENLEATDKLKDQFLSILSHELRTPINAIMGFGSILDDEIAGSLTGQQHEYLGKMMGGAEVLLALVDDLLDMTRIRAGRFALSTRTMTFSDAAKSVISGMSALADKKRIRLVDEIPTDLPPLIADKQRVIQVLTNLIGNAIKFTPEHGTVRVRARLDGQSLCCEVQDTGIGIPEKDLPKLFQPFTQLDSSYTRKAGGTGLGLSISKALVEAHGGSIGAESAGGDRGSTFWFRLPLAGPTNQEIQA